LAPRRRTVERRQPVAEGHSAGRRQPRAELRGRSRGGAERRTNADARQSLAARVSEAGADRLMTGADRLSIAADPPTTTGLPSVVWCRGLATTRGRSLVCCGAWDAWCRAFDDYSVLRSRLLRGVRRPLRGRSPSGAGRPAFAAADWPIGAHGWAITRARRSIAAAGPTITQGRPGDCCRPAGDCCRRSDDRCRRLDDRCR
jgi:hypothetical protein